jgi:hypothetical protein
MKPGFIAALLALALSAGAAAAQPANSFKDQIVGSWNFVVAEVTAPDGKKSFPFGETPKGILIFTPDGRFAQIHVAGDVPKIASNNRLTATPEEYAAIMRGSLSVFGTYTVDEAKKTVTYHIVSAWTLVQCRQAELRMGDFHRAWPPFRAVETSAKAGPRCESICHG